MKDAQTGIIEALKYAIQMELDGKKFYTLSGQESTNKIGKELFSWLAEQEDFHRKRFEEIYVLIAKKKDWPLTPVKPDKNRTFRTLFGDALRDVGTSLKAQKSEFIAAEKAIEMEIKSRDFYTERASKAASDIEKNFFITISAEEQGHYLALIDYKEYMSDPAGWFTRTEHHSLDGN
ncbi:MAG: ferritin family protein [Dehalococcoidia bacterium]|jgi:rubrerythrin